VGRDILESSPHQLLYPEGFIIFMKKIVSYAEINEKRYMQIKQEG